MAALYPGGRHPYMPEHGPWDLYRCKDCGSHVTYPLPTGDQLKKLYASFDGGMIPSIRLLREKYPLTAWYHQCRDHALAQAGIKPGNIGDLKWADLGAGAGEISLLMAETFPQSTGLACDLGDRPPNLHGKPQVQWMRLQSLEGQDDFPSIPLDLALCITVTEHLPDPEAFIEAWTKRLAGGGCFYLTSPRTDAMACSWLGRKWPYYLPGEHLHIPSRAGMRILLDRVGRKHFGENGYEVNVRSVVLPYPVGYFLEYFKMGKWLPRALAQIALHIPTGMLEASLRRR